MKFKICRKHMIILILVCMLSTVSNNLQAKADEIYVNARCAVALDSKSGVVLYEKDAHHLVPFASTTKIVTSLVALKYGDLDKKVDISEKSADIGGSTVGYKKGEKITLKELLYGLMLRSGNDAAIAIAEGVSGSVEEFMKLMNEYAVQIGLCDTHFETPHGLDRDNHYSTAYDLAIATAKAKETKLFCDIVGAKDVAAEEHGFTRSYHNINKILWQLPDADGVKTGFTGKAGKCLVTSIHQEKGDVIIVVLNSNERWKVTKKIRDYVADRYEYRKLFSRGEVIADIPVINGKDKARLTVTDDIVIPMKKGTSYLTKWNIPKQLQAPVTEGTIIGVLTIFDNNQLYYSKSFTIEKDIKKKSIIKKWLFF